MIPESGSNLPADAHVVRNAVVFRPAGLHASQVAAEAPVIPNNPRRFLPRQLSDSTADISSCDDAEDHEAQPPSTKRQRSNPAIADLLVAQAQHALAAVMARKQQQAVFPSGAHTNQPIVAAAAANGPSCAMGTGLPPVVPLSGHRAASLNDMMEAAEILTAFTAPSLYADTQLPISQEAYCHSDPWNKSMALEGEMMNITADEGWTVPVFTVGPSRPAAGAKPAPKPRKKAAAATGGAARQPGKARKVADKRNTTHVSAPLLSSVECPALQSVA
jgi:hypothetical protein